MMKIYKIKNWENLFETAETRKRKYLHWLPVPNKHDGLGFKKMLKEKDKERLFCYWNLILQIASKTTPECRRGYLERDGIPLSAEDMADIAGFAADGFKRALEFFSSNGNTWLDITYKESAEGAAESANIAASSAVEQNRTEQKEGTEQNIYDDVVAYWNSKQELPKIIKLSDERKKHLRQRLKDKWWIENWRNAIDRICNSDFCLGKIPRNDGKRAWNANFEWFIKPSSAINIMEGKYDNKANIQGGTLKLTKEQEDEQARIAML